MGEAGAVAAAGGIELVAGLGGFRVLATVVTGGRCGTADAGVRRGSWRGRLRGQACHQVLLWLWFFPQEL